MKTLKKWMIGAVALMMVTTVQGQENRRLTKEIRKNMLDAYSYRTDISKEVLAQTKKWPENTVFCTANGLRIQTASLSHCRAR